MDDSGAVNVSDYLSVFLVFVLTFLNIYFATQRRSGVPPGPQCWPCVGNLPSLVGADTLGIINKLRGKYGDVFGLYIGSELTVVVNGYDAIHDALVKRGSSFMFRPNNYFTRNQDLKGGVIFEDGKVWKVKRTYLMNSIRDLCYTNSGLVLDRLINCELQGITEYLDSLQEPQCLRQILSLSFANVMFSIIHGRRAGYDNERFNWYLKTIDQAFKDFSNNQVKCYCFPFLRYLPGDLLREKWSHDTNAILHNYFDEMCKPEFETYEDGRHSCLVDYLLQADSPCAREDIWKLLHELMAAGSETSATTLNWLILLLVMNPEKQETLHQKITEVLGNEEPSVRDKGRIPYVEAAILETLRIGSNVPLAMPHSVNKDVHFHDYLIPEGATILPNLASVHFDPAIFTSPQEFKPERFLRQDESGVTIFTPCEKVVPFSLGQRSCLGESLARIELFMYVVTLTQRYKFEQPKDSSPPSLQGVFGITHRPQDYKVIVVRRNAPTRA